MHKQRIYIDTSVIGGCFDEPFECWSNILIEEFISGKKIAVISDITINEIKRAKNINVFNKINELPPQSFELIFKDTEIEFLAKKYIEYGALTNKSYNDALHIASATIKNVNFLVSWNFRHIVNVNKISIYNSGNIRLGCKILDIKTPKEVINYE